MHSSRIRHARSLLLLVAVSACSRGSEARVDTTSPAPAATAAAPAPNPDAPIMLRGTIASVSPTELVIKTDSAAVTVKVEQPFHLYTRQPSDMSHVTQSSFIGVTTVKQANGSEQATEIHVFPDDLRGLGEGSRMMTPAAGAAGSAASRMTNGTASPAPPEASRMSNGIVSSSNGATLVVQYAGGSQHVTVPPNTPVTTFILSSTPLAVGDQVAIVVTKASDGTLTSSKGVSTKK